MNRRQFLGGLAGAAALTTMDSSAMLPGAAKPGRSKPNIVLMLVDDLGYGDFACYGSQFHETPEIDRLAREGMKFTQAYAAAPVCSPSRCGILTGQHPARVHLTQWIPGVIYPHKKLNEPNIALHLPKGTPTLGSELKKQGYQTASIGKWHLGGAGFYPEDFGFDLNIAGDANGHPAPPHDYFGPFKYHNLTGYTEHDNLTEVLTDQADRFLESAAPKGPFFLYLAEYAVHLPLDERPEHIEKYKRKNHGADEPDPIYAAMVESVDTALGRLRKKLTELKVADNTIIILTSDNGGVGFQGRSLHRVGDNGPFHGGKGFVYEGGIREPLIVHWPGVTKPGSICQMPVYGCDFLPTLLSMARAEEATPTPCDGLDFSPLLRGEAVLKRDALYWHYPHYSDQGGTPSGAIREGDWKLIEFFEDEHVELYNLKVDIGEQFDFASSYSDEAVRLRAKLHQWRQEVKADMPSSNPNYDPTRVGDHEGLLGCSAAKGPRCAED
ncbi:MAG: sulfatase [Acidobacteriota bacterium]